MASVREALKKKRGGGRRVLASVCSGGEMGGIPSEFPRILLIG